MQSSNSVKFLFVIVCVLFVRVPLMIFCFCLMRVGRFAELIYDWADGYIPGFRRR